MTDIALSAEQSKVRDELVARLREGAALVTLGGYAGTGKTTLISKTVPILREFGFDRIAFCCYTGKAKDVLRAKLEAEPDVIVGDEYVGTLHGLLYSAHADLVRQPSGGHRVVMRFSDRGGIERPDLVIVDEASMVDEEIFADLKKLGIPILAVGDHGQLPPVRPGFNLMADPMLRLESIHRQAAGNPIIRLSEMARRGEDIPPGNYGDAVVKTLNTAHLSVYLNWKKLTDYMFLCGTNRLRGSVNRWVRSKSGLTVNAPQIGERLICLQNNHGAGVMNGMLGTLRRIAKAKDPHWWSVDVDMDAAFKYSGDVLKYQFGAERKIDRTIDQAPDLDPRDLGDLFDYGYCLTVHKAQGSEADSVVLFEEVGMRRMMETNDGPEAWRRWLYTGITRARKNLLIIGNVSQNPRLP